MSHLEPRVTRWVQQKRHSGASDGLVRRAPSTCTDSGDLYVLPASGANVDSARQTTISWNAACLNSTSQIDIYLYAPLQPSASLPIHAWTHVPASEGSYSVKLAPKWWNSTASVELSLNIVPTGNQPWDSSFSYGPAWYATYTAPTDGSAPPADAVVGSSDSNSLISIFYKAGQLTKGGIAAAIVVPLLVVFIALGIWIRKMHLSRNNKLADWAEHMDKRMSKISLDWTSGGDGTAGPVPGSRPDSFARPQSSYRPSVDAVRAAYAQSVANQTGTEAGHTDYAEMSEAHQRGESMYSARRSNYRVSFAPSTEHSHGKNRQSSYSNARPMPKVDTQRFANSKHDDSSEEFVMSPTQNAGAAPLNVDSLRKSMDEQVRQSMLEYPALQMVDGGESSAGEAQEQAYEEFHETAAEESDRHLAAPSPSSLVSSHTGMAPPTNAVSPDAALKHYAALRAAAGPSPQPFASEGSKMRNLYGAQPLQSAQSIATSSSIDDNDIVGYNQMIDGPPRH